MAEPMSDTEYTVQLQSIFNLGALVRGLDIAGVLARMETAEAIGPVLDPSLYQRAAGRLDWHRQAAEAALAFQGEIERLAAGGGEGVADG